MKKTVYDCETGKTKTVQMTDAEVKLILADQKEAAAFIPEKSEMEVLKETIEALSARVDELSNDKPAE